MSTPSDPRSTSDRMLGCIVTFENEGGRLLTLHRDGPPQDALKVLCNQALDRDDSYRIVSYSTPGTIMADLAGRKPSNPKQTRAGSVEVRLVSAAGLRAMVHPRLLATSEGNLSERQLRWRRERRAS